MFLARVDPPRSLEAPPYRVRAYARPHGGRPHGGDRLAVQATAAGLVFAVADAAGHGPAGQQFWDRWETALAARWRTLCAGPCEIEDLHRFARDVNDELHDAGDHLALAVGALGPHGRLRHAVCGYGVHVLASARGSRIGPPPSAAAFGLKLGWFATPEWDGTGRAFVGHERPGVRQVVVLTDGFLGEDHRDVARTLRELGELGATCARLDAGAALDHVRALPHGGDDATVLVLSPPPET